MYLVIEFKKKISNYTSLPYIFQKAKEQKKSSLWIHALPLVRGKHVGIPLLAHGAHHLLQPLVAAHAPTNEHLLRAAVGHRPLRDLHEHGEHGLLQRVAQVLGRELFVLDELGRPRLNEAQYAAEADVHALVLCKEIRRSNYQNNLNFLSSQLFEYIGKHAWSHHFLRAIKHLVIQTIFPSIITYLNKTYKEEKNYKLQNEIILLDWSKF